MESEQENDNGHTPKQRAINQLLDDVDLRLLGGDMQSDYRQGLFHYLMDSAVTNISDDAEQARRIVREAFHLVSASGSFWQQR